MPSSIPLEIRPGVAAALQAKKPVIALASSPLTYTLPWPSNFESLKQLDVIARQEGATLALIAVSHGRLIVGLEAAELEKLSHSRNLHRVSRRDLPAAIVGRWDAGTTVSATMCLAERLGIRLVVSGSIGTARYLFDDEHQIWEISSDLVELSRTPVAVVCAGARSASLPSYPDKFLDTFRVPVLGYQTDLFPVFYMNAGAAPVTLRVDRVADAARFLGYHWELEGGGAVIAQQTPEAVAISPDELIPALRMVEDQAQNDRVKRKDFSPFMMDKLNRLTGGKAQIAYQAILAANTRLAAQIAVELSQTESNVKN